jgi:hypothetical protein
MTERGEETKKNKTFGICTTTKGSSLDHFSSELESNFCGVQIRRLIDHLSLKV